MAKKYTDSYVKARDVFLNQQYEAGWQTFLTNTCHVTSFLGADGFSVGHQSAADSVRKKIGDDAAGATKGAVILKASQNAASAGSLQERAAALKMLKHTYLILESGAQQVWVYSPPKGHAGWIFDEVVGSPEVIEPKLSDDDEIFSPIEMKWMSAALKLSLKVSEDTQVLLKAKSEATLEVVKRWFIDEDSGDAQIDEALAKLSAGFQKISAVCSSNRLVFTDYPDWRAQRDRYFGGAIRGGEGGNFPVIYIEGAFTRLTGNTGKMWLCVETIIHEFSHHEVRTRDHRYDSAGLKPKKGTFPFAQAIDNADSWGYFALDLAGLLSDSDRSRTCK